MSVGSPPTPATGLYTEAAVPLDGNTRFTDPDEPGETVDAPVSRENAHFTWTGLKLATASDPESYTNPVTVVAAGTQNGEDDGHAASAAKIVVDYAGSAVKYDTSFTFGAGSDAITVSGIKEGWGVPELTSHIVSAINAANKGWTAKASGTVVTLERSATGSLDDPSTVANEWDDFYDDPAHLGGKGSGSGTQGVVDVVVSGSTLTSAQGGNFKFLGLEGTVGNTATDDDIADAIAAAFDIAKANDTLPAALANWGTVVSDGSGTLTFTQQTGQLVEATALFPNDNLFTEDTSVRPVGITVTSPVVTAPQNSSLPTIVSYGLTVGSNGHPGGVITVNGNDIIIQTGSTAAQIATLVAAAYPTVTDWGVTASGDYLVFTSTSNNVDPLTLIGTHSVSGQITAAPADTAAEAVLEALVDTSALTWTHDPADAFNGINADIITTPGNTADGKDAWKEEIGTVNPAWDIEGDGDYLDFSYWNAYKVEVNGVTVAQTSDLAGTGDYVSITGGAGGVYTFNLIDGSNSTLIGVVDFGEAVSFDNTNFILYDTVVV